MYGNRGLNAYRTNQIKNRADVASPYRLAQMLFQNLLDGLIRTRGAIERQDARLRGEQTGRCMDMINALRCALDHSINPEMTENLDRLYSYCNQCLLNVNRSNDSRQLEQVISVIGQIKSTWDQLESRQHNE